VVQTVSACSHEVHPVDVLEEPLRTPSLTTRQSHVLPGRAQSHTWTTLTSISSDRLAWFIVSPTLCRPYSPAHASASPSTETRGWSTNLKVCRPTIDNRTTMSRCASSSGRTLRTDCCGTSAIDTALRTSVSRYVVDILFHCSAASRGCHGN